MIDFTEAELTDEFLAQPGVLEALAEEIKSRAILSTQYKKERDEAKTEVKRKHFHNKLVRNNEESADMLVAMERVITAREKHGTDVKGDAEASSTPEESAE